MSVLVLVAVPVLEVLDSCGQVGWERIPKRKLATVVVPVYDHPVQHLIPQRGNDDSVVWIVEPFYFPVIHRIWVQVEFWEPVWE